MALVGLLTLLSLLSRSHSQLTGAWVGGLSALFGSGMYLLPAGLILVGLWLVLRNFERIPWPGLERLLGLAMLYLAALVLLHLVYLPEDRSQVFALAEQGAGGGYLGAVVLEGLRTTLGLGGAVIAWLAWLTIGLALWLDMSVLELFTWIPTPFIRLMNTLQEKTQNWLDDVRQRRAQKSPSYTGYGPESLPSAYSQVGEAGLTGPAAAVTALTYPLPVPAGGKEGQRAWVLPALDEILDKGYEVDHDDAVDLHRARTIEETLSSFGAPARVVEINRGPTITQFGVEPDFVESRGGRMRVRVGKIAALADDLALVLSARTIRIQAPVPGKGYVGIEVPNDQIASVALRDVIESEAFKRVKSALRFALGQDVAGRAAAADLTAMPHLLIAGATGSGKSVCVNSLISSLLLFNTPDDLRLIMVDPKRVELTGYNGIPHLLAPVVVEMDRVVGALKWVTREMDMRYHKLAEAGSRNILDYNVKAAGRGVKKLPYLVVIIDELADLMMLAPDETERTITRLAQLARATGIHLVIATQRPSVDVVTGLIKANFPARIAFAVASNVDSRTILDQPGAERLLGRGDMLFQAPDAPAPVRLQGAYLSDSEILRLVTFWQTQAGTVEGAPTAAGGNPADMLPAGAPLKQIALWEDFTPQEESDPLLNEAIDLSRRQGRASISMLQRRLRIGYTRAARLVETMEAKGIVGPPEAGTGTREILDYGQAAPPVGEQ
jgi:S-DNA-T family DNA segregation ATPase FtsK/SpoIIIE